MRTKMVFKLVYFLLAFSVVFSSVGFVDAVQLSPDIVNSELKIKDTGVTASKAPIGYVSTKKSISKLGSMSLAGSNEALLIQNVLPWSSNANTEVLNKLNIGFDTLNMSQTAGTDLSRYKLVIISDDQDASFYFDYNFLRSKFEDFVKKGGILVMGACYHGWNGGELTYDLPGGVKLDYLVNYENTIVDKTHPIITGELTDGKFLTDDYLKSEQISLTVIKQSSLPAGSKVIIRTKDTFEPTLVEYPLGAGKVIANGLAWEYYWLYRTADIKYAVRAFDDYYAYAWHLAKKGVSIDIKMPANDSEYRVGAKIPLVTAVSGTGFSYTKLTVVKDGTATPVYESSKLKGARIFGILLDVFDTAKLSAGFYRISAAVYNSNNEKLDESSVNVILTAPVTPKIKSITLNPTTPVTMVETTFTRTIDVSEANYDIITEWYYDDNLIGTTTNKASFKYVIPSEKYKEKAVKCVIKWKDKLDSSLSGTDTKTRNFKVYFRKNSDDDGDGEPNWFEFWNTDGAVPGLSNFNYDASMASYGVYHPGSDTFDIGPEAAGTHYSRTITANSITFGGARGIDCAAEVCAHELYHQFVNNNLSGTDNDDDGLPNDYETDTSHTDIDNPDTYDLEHNKSPVYAAYGDQEYMAMVAGNGKQGIDANDWASPGMQAGGSVGSLTALNVDTTSEVGAADTQQPQNYYAGSVSNGSDLGVDTDGNNLYDLLRVTLGLDGLEAGNYQMVAKLKDINGKDITFVNKQIGLDSENKSIQIDFNGNDIQKSGVNGALTINLSLYQDGELLNTLNYATGEYSSGMFEDLPAEFNGNYTEQALDSNEDGIFDGLIINVGLDIRESGNYKVEGRLYDENNNNMDWNSTIETFDAESVSVPLKFDGSIIESQKVSGHYKLMYLTVKNQNDEQIDFKLDPYTTKTYYNSGDFGSPLKPDLTISADNILTLPVSPRADETYYIWADIRNNGQNYAENVNVLLLVDGNTVSEKNIDILMPDSYNTVDFECKIPKGSHSVEIQVDSKNDINEIDELNNSCKWDVVGVLPDFTVTSVSSQFYPQQIMATIANLGAETDNTSLKVELYKGTTLLQSKILDLDDAVTNTSPNTWDILFNIEDLYLEGTHSFTVKVDTDNAFEEQFEDNNSISIEVFFPEKVYGDLNNDGVFNEADYELMKWYLLHQISQFPNKDWRILGDVTGDKVINVCDLYVMKSKLLGKIAKFPAEH